MPDTLYEQDFYRWTQEQARALRARAEQGANLPVDWESVAEEIESLGRSDRREVTSRLRTIMEHLLKLEHSPAREPRHGWRRTVTTQRIEVNSLLNESPSLKGQVSTLAEEAAEGAVRLAIDALEEGGETAAAVRAKLAGARHTVSQLLEDWFPPEPK